MAARLPRTTELRQVIAEGRVITEFGAPATKARNEVREYSVSVYATDYRRRFLMSYLNERTAILIGVPDNDDEAFLSLHDLARDINDPEGLVRIEQRLPFWAALDMARGCVTGGVPNR